MQYQSDQKNTCQHLKLNNIYDIKHNRPYGKFGGVVHIQAHRGHDWLRPALSFPVQTFQTNPDHSPVTTAVRCDTLHTSKTSRTCVHPHQAHDFHCNPCTSESQLCGSTNLPVLPVSQRVNVYTRYI